MTDDPFKPLTRIEGLVAECVGKGWGYARIGAEMLIEVETARSHVRNIAAKLPTDDGVRAYLRVFLWVNQRKWADQLSEIKKLDKAA